MTPFWISTGLLTLLVLALLCWPLLRRRSGDGASRRAINTAIYRDQLADLERDLASGTLSQADYAGAREEIERRVLEDVAADTAPTDTAPRRLPRTALALAVTLPLAAALLYVVLGTPAALDPAARQGPQASAAEIEKMVATLAARLEKDPGNLEGWAMLGRSYLVTGRLAEAAKAFDKAGPAMEASTELMLQVAELSAELNEGRIEGRGRELLHDRRRQLELEHVGDDLRPAVDEVAPAVDDLQAARRLLRPCLVQELQRAAVVELPRPRALGEHHGIRER